MTASHLTTVGQGSGEWQTPPEVFRALHRRWRFDFDAWASHQNALCPSYATPDGAFSRSRLSGLHPEPFKLYPLDGFEVPWTDRRVFGNPPFTRGLIDRCVQKFVAEAQRDFNRTPQCAVYLVPSAPDTQWYQALEEVALITPFPRRIRFIHPPFLCGDKCQTGKEPHRLGEPLPNPPGPMVVAEMKQLRRHWLGVLLRQEESSVAAAG